MIMVAFTDSQLRAVWAAADRLPFEKRGVFVERVVARLQLQRGFTDADLDDAVCAALRGLIPSAA
jgi:alkylhydroperoxidase family enzyme